MARKIINKAWPYGLIVLIVVIFATFSFKAAEVRHYNINYSDYTIPEGIIIDLEEKLIELKSAHVEKVFKQLQFSGGFNGTVLLAEKGRIVYKGAFGYADHEQRIKLETNSKFQLASVSKMFTAMSILILYDKGLLDLDDEVTKYLVGFPYEGITIRHLLTHRSGLPRYMSLADEKWKDKTRPLTNNDVLELIKKYKPKTYYKPDKVFHYCNTNYALLASIVEVVSKTPFNRFVSMNIFHPLAMNNSLVYNHRFDSVVTGFVPVGVQGYNGSWRPVKVYDNYLNGVMGDKGIYSTVEDLFKFDQALNNGSLISDTTLRKAFSPGSPVQKSKDNYGFGWRIHATEDSCVYHYGWWKGFRTFFIRDLKNQKSIIVLTNHSKGPGSQIFWDVIKNNQYNLGFKTDLKYYPITSLQ